MLPDEPEAGYTCSKCGRAGLARVDGTPIDSESGIPDFECMPCLTGESSLCGVGPRATGAAGRLAATRLQNERHTCSQCGKNNVLRCDGAPIERNGGVSEFWCMECVCEEPGDAPEPGAHSAAARSGAGALVDAAGLPVDETGYPIDQDGFGDVSRLPGRQLTRQPVVYGPLPRSYYHPCNQYAKSWGEE